MSTITRLSGLIDGPFLRPLTTYAVMAFLGLTLGTLVTMVSNGMSTSTAGLVVGIGAVTLVGIALFSIVMTAIRRTR